uniref:CxC3 like cysteine cluster domain-containing protein n=1 Tax=Daphnia galeata TaxID=27404 RepID=A0A8J2WJV8_9CRUS|nr:unnamed protein product [Daphnia galeata]
MKEICVPCFVPIKCGKCNCEGKMRLVPNSDRRLNITVIMLEGLFDLRASGFHCMEWKLFIDADKNDDIFSGFWPASTTAPISYLFSEEVFLMWHHLRHKSPLNSGNIIQEETPRYEKFARKVALAFPEYQPMNKMKGMLPRMHAKSHHWPCQILYNPHWQKGAGLTVGVEHEQVFSNMSLYGYVTKHMSKANRIDLFSAAILYWNWGKIEMMREGVNSQQSNEKKSCKTRTRFRGVLSKLKAKAVKLVSEINTKKESQNCPISMEDFEKGIFPWDFNSDDHEENKSFAYLSISEKYEIVDTWMLLQRAEEEIKLCEMEMKTYLLYLVSTRSSLKKNLIFEDVSYGQTNTKFLAGKAVLSRGEIARFSRNECEYEQTQDSEFDSQDVDESYYDESSGSEVQKKLIMRTTRSSLIAKATE